MKDKHAAGSGGPSRIDEMAAAAVERDLNTRTSTRSSLQHSAFTIRHPPAPLRARCSDSPSAWAETDCPSSPKSPSSLAITIGAQSVSLMKPSFSSSFSSSSCSFACSADAAPVGAVMEAAGARGAAVVPPQPATADSTPQHNTTQPRPYAVSENCEQDILQTFGEVRQFHRSGRPTRYTDALWRFRFELDPQWPSPICQAVVATGWKLRIAELGGAVIHDSDAAFYAAQLVEIEASPPGKAPAARPLQQSFRRSGPR